MDPTTASYYRSVLFSDSQDLRPLPPSLVVLHAWIIKRCQAMGLGGTIAKATAVTVALAWLSSTKEGRAFTRDNTTLGDLFCADDDETECESDSGSIDWVKLPLETKVVVVIDEKPTVGEYIGRRSSRIDVRIAGERKSFKRNEVKLAGA